MKNNTIGTVRIASSKRDNTYKNKSAALHTSMDFGSVMCGKLQRIVPNSSLDVSTHERVLLASLVRPTFGRIQLKGYHYFCPFSDLTENYAPMMAQQPVFRGSNSFTPLNIPFIPIKELSIFVLHGAQCTIYQEYQASYAGDTYDDLLKIPSNVQFDAAAGALPQDCQDALSDLGISTGTPSYMPNTIAYRFDIDLLLGSGYSAHSSHFYVSNPTPASFFDFRSEHPDESAFGSDFVSLVGADYIVPVDVGSKRYTLAFRLSSFGRRLRKNLIGCGWEFNLRSDKPFSILPLVAYFKTYFDVFGLTLYNNYESTYAYKIMRTADLVANPMITYSAGTGFTRVSMSDFAQFMMNEFGATYFTDEQDFVSSHTRSTAVSPSQQAFIDGINTDVYVQNGGKPNIDVSGVQPSQPSGIPSGVSGHAFINGVVHGQLDSELLKRLYRQTNVNTIAGRRIAELLRAQGFGSYVDECKSNFIGSFSLDLNVFDLPSQSDTYNAADDSGKHLGEFGAYGRGSGSQKYVHYETSEDGYFITLLCIVPYGGYAEGVDQDALNIRKYEQYNLEFDSKGMEFNPKLIIHGSQPIASPIGDNVGSLDDSFGLAPRDFKRKFGRSVLNGEFSLRSTRRSYDPFHLERILDIGERDFAVSSESSTATRFTSRPRFNPSDMPLAGDVWRYLTRYPWLSRFQRIFYNDVSGPRLRLDVDFSVEKFEYFSLLNDDFVVHMLFDFPVYDDMLPVQDSFETTDDEHHANGQMSKA